MKIVPGLYAIENWRYVVVGVSTNTETGEQCVLCQQFTSLFPFSFFLVPLGKFAAGMGADQKIVEQYDAPRLLKPSRGAYGITPGLYGHFKNPLNTYNVIAVARNTETGERCVLYQPLYGEYRYRLCHRPKAMFFERVEKPEHNYSGPRFFLMDAYCQPRIAA